MRNLTCALHYGNIMVGLEAVGMGDISANFRVKSHGEPGRVHPAIHVAWSGKPRTTCAHSTTVW